MFGICNVKIMSINFLLRTLQCDEQKWYFVSVRINCCSDQEKLLKFEAEDQEFANFLRLLEQFIQTVKGQNNFW